MKPWKCMLWLVVYCSLSIGPAACRHSWSKYKRTGPVYTRRSPDCRIRYYSKAPKGDYAVLGIVEAGLSLHFSQGHATLHRASDLLEAQACRLGANAIMELESSYSAQDDYTVIHLWAKAIAVSKPMATPLSGREKHYRRIWPALVKSVKRLRPCLEHAGGFVVHTDQSGHISRIAPVEQNKHDSQVLRCLRRKLQQICFGKLYGFRSILIYLSPLPAGQHKNTPRPAAESDKKTRPSRNGDRAGQRPAGPT